MLRNDDDDDDDESFRTQSPCLSVNETTRSSISGDETTFMSPTQSRRAKKKKRTTEAMSELETSFLELAKAQSSRLNSRDNEQPTRDATDAFFESCSLRAKQLPKYKQSWLQLQVSMLLYAAETDDNLPPVMSSMAYPFEPRQVYQHPQTYTQLSPVQENLHQEHVSVLPVYTYQTNTSCEYAGCNETNSQIHATQGSGLDILTEAMSHLE